MFHYQRELAFCFQLLLFPEMFLVLPFSSPLVLPNPKWLRLWSSATYKLDASIPMLYTCENKRLIRGFLPQRTNILPDLTDPFLQEQRDACREVFEPSYPKPVPSHALRCQLSGSSPRKVSGQIIFGENKWRLINLPCQWRGNIQTRHIPLPMISQLHDT